MGRLRLNVLSDAVRSPKLRPGGVTGTGPGERLGVPVSVTASVGRPRTPVGPRSINYRHPRNVLLLLFHTMALLPGHGDCGQGLMPCPPGTGHGVSTRQDLWRVRSPPVPQVRLQGCHVDQAFHSGLEHKLFQGNAKKYVFTHLDLQIFARLRLVPLR